MIVGRYEVPGTRSKKSDLLPAERLIARIGPTAARGLFVLHEGATYIKAVAVYYCGRGESLCISNQ
jgi:hypothetical protein